MMNTKLALIISVSAYALQINPVYASLLSSPPASILDTNIHTPARLAAHPQGVASQTCHNVQSSAPARQVAESGLLVNRGLNALLGNVPNDSVSDEQTKKTRGVAESGLLVDGNFQNKSSTVILGLDPRIQVKQGFLSHLDNSDLAVVSTASAVSQQQVSLRLLSQRNVSCVALRPSVKYWHDNSAGIPRHEAKTSAQHDNFIQLASVCFITDTGSCSGNTFGDGEGYPNKPNPIDPIPPVPDEDKCSELGFKKTSCSEGYSPAGFCPYNSTYFKECVCTEACPNGYQDYPCGSGLLQADTVTPNCKTCYKCVACEDECPSGHTTESGACRQASSYVTECGNKCYKILSNSCKSGQLSAPAESGGYKNKIVSYTDCGNPCFQSYNDNCATGYVKTKESGKCYETTAKYTAYGSACYKEKSCCDDTCSGYRATPTTYQCQWGYNSGQTACGNPCYTCKACISNCSGFSSVMPQNCQYGLEGCTDQCTNETLFKCSECQSNCPGMVTIEECRNSGGTPTGSSCMDQCSRTVKVPCSAGSGSGSDSETGDGAGNTPSDCHSINSSYYNTEQSEMICSLITEKYDRGYGCYYCTKYYCQDFATENEQCEWTSGIAEGRVPYEVYVYDSNKNFLYTKSFSSKYIGTTVCFSFGSDSWKETHLKQCNDCVAEKGRKAGDLIKSYYQCF